MPARPLLRYFRLIRPQDFVWLLLFAVLAVTNAEGDVSEIALFAALAVAQVLEPKIPAHPSTRSRIFWIVVKLLLGYLTCLLARCSAISG